MSNAKNWCFTLNNYTDDEYGRICTCGADPHVVSYMVVGKEVGETGTPHLQGFVQFKDKKRLAPVKALLSERLHLEPMRGTALQASDYCKKEGDVTEYGTIMSQGKRTDLHDVCADIQSGKRLKQIAADHPCAFIKFNRGIAALIAVTQQATTAENVRGIWVYGEPGTGKSHWVRSLYPEEDIYHKSQNKWWDSYQGEENVLLDDLDHGARGLGHHFKLWADKWPVTGEIKGATVSLCYSHFYVTSNYHPCQIWNPKEDPAMYAAIRRRFEVLEKTTQELPPIPLPANKEEDLVVNLVYAGPGAYANTFNPID